MAPVSKTIALSEFAADHGLTLIRVQQWIAEGMPYRQVDGARMVVRSEANKWVRQRERASGEESAAPKDLEEADKRKAMADAQLAELKLLREQGKGVSIEETEKAVGDLLGALRAQLLATPTRESHRIVGLRSLAEATAALDAIIYDLMTSLSRRGPELAEDPGRR